MNEKIKYSLTPRKLEIPVYIAGGMLGGATGGIDGAVVVAVGVYALSSLGKALYIL